MTAFLWMCFGMAIGFTIGVLSSKRGDDFVISVQRHLKPGQMISIAMDHWDVEDLGDDDGKGKSCQPLMPDEGRRFRYN